VDSQGETSRSGPSQVGVAQLVAGGGVAVGEHGTYHCPQAPVVDRRGGGLGTTRAPFGLPQGSDLADMVSLHAVLKLGQLGGGEDESCEREYGFGR
jgi:hypothetical protein